MTRVAGNPKTSKWYSTPQKKRRRKLVGITLSDEAREILEWLAEDRQETKSEIVEELLVREGRSPKGES